MAKGLDGEPFREIDPRNLVVDVLVLVVARRRALGVLARGQDGRIVAAPVVAAREEVVVRVGRGGPALLARLRSCEEGSTSAPVYAEESTVSTRTATLGL